MTKLNFTPGPWFLVTAYSNGNTIMQPALAVGPQQQSTTPNDLICLISPLNQATKQDEANAKLIAAAPEILDALILANKLITGWIPAASEDHMKIKNAIKLATE